MLKRNVDLKDINQNLYGRPIMIKKPCNLIIETDKPTTTKREFGSSSDTTLVNEINSKKVLKFGNCPLVVREKSSIHLNDDSSKSDASIAESSQTNPTIVVHKRINHLSPLPITKKGIPIPSPNTNNSLGSRSHHYGSRDKFNRRKHCHRHNHHSDEKIVDRTLLDSERVKNEFYQLSTAYNILSDETERSQYDRWRAGSIKIPYKMWKEMVMKKGHVS
ncbi:20325_t:CDS:2 [Gigaspora margarita]|uniref:20325_t:CDS:1 n=1 Tax=Gigaspora margarita TaxID=4874 RepID=A0ABN7V5T5_GIGMA|nr:20325_t:CDS:2 [Gigaspora margarita]